MALIACARRRSDGIAGRPIGVGGLGVIGGEDASLAERVVWRTAGLDRSPWTRGSGTSPRASAHLAWLDERCAAAFHARRAPVGRSRFSSIAALVRSRSGRRLGVGGMIGR